MRLNHWLAFGFMVAAGPLVGCGGGDLVLPNEGVPARIEIVGGNAQTATVSAALPESLVVRVLDSRDRPVVNQRVDFAAAAGSGVLTPVSSTTDADGLAAAQWVLGATAGAQSATARPVGNGAPTNLVAAFSATATASRAAAVEIVAGSGQTATAGTSVAVPPSVRVLDSEGNPVSGLPVTFAVTAGGGSVNPTTPVTTGTDGAASVASWTLGTAAGANSLTATVPGTGVAGNPAIFTATAEAGSAGRLLITRQPPSSGQSGVPLSPAVQVQLQDRNGNDVRQAGVAIAAEIASGPSGGQLSGDIAQTNGNGLATFSSLTITGLAGSYTINFSGANLTGATSTPVTLAAGGGTKLVFAVQPSGSASSGVAFATQPQLQIQDAAGNPVASGGVQVTASISSGPSGGSVGGTTTVSTNSSGLAAFTNLSISGPTGAYALLFAAPGVTPATANVSLGAGSPSGSQSTFSINPTTITASTGGSAATVTVTARDGSGNPIQGAAVAVNVSPSANATVSNPAPTNVNGQTTATISSTLAGAKTVTVTINGISVTNPSSATLTVVAASPSAATSTTVASTTSPVVGQPVTLTITVKDAFGNPVPGRTVTLNGDGQKTQPATPTNSQGVTTGAVTFLSGGVRSVRPRVEGSPDVDLQEVEFDVQRAATTTTLVTAKNPVFVGEQVTLTATVTVSAPGSGSPGGTVRFFDGATQIDSDGLSGGVATATVSFGVAGTHQLTAVYDGSGNFDGSTSNAVAQQVNIVPTTTEVTASSTSVFGEAVSFTVSVSSPFGTPAGSARLFDGGSCASPGAPIGGPTALDGSGDVTIPVSGGVLTAGPHTVVGCYLGSGTHAPSGGTTSHQVNKAGTATTITSDEPDPSVVFQSVHVEFELAITSGAGTPGGTITLDAGGSSICSLSVSGAGIYSCDWVPSSTGDAIVLTATYTGNADFQGSSDAELHDVGLLQ